MSGENDRRKEMPEGKEGKEARRKIQEEGQAVGMGKLERKTEEGNNRRKS